MPSLNWKHHALIQALMTRGPLKEKDFHAIFSGLTSKSPGAHQGLFNEYLLNINKELSSCQFELRACRDQYVGQVCYGVVNNVADEQSKLGTKYTVQQIAFFKGIGSQLVDGPLPAAFRNFTMSQKEKTLDEFVQDQWLCRTPDGKIGLGVRSCLDLRGWFRNLDVPFCEVCNEAVVKGEILCPRCGLRWPNQVPKAEILDEEEVPNATIQSQPAQGPKRKRTKTNETHAKDAVGCGSSQSSVPNSDFRRITRRSSRPASQS
ncbi:non-structural maintenance of chromosomes element 1-like [Citrus sinensis]|nr:non-structural maintenance of chromosomes element 1-like [Citrus sinensis]